MVQVVAQGSEFGRAVLAACDRIDPVHRLLLRKPIQFAIAHQKRNRAVAFATLINQRRSCLVVEAAVPKESSGGLGFEAAVVLGVLNAVPDEQADGGYPGDGETDRAGQA